MHQEIPDGAVAGNASRARFVTTRWSLIRELQASDPARRNAARARLVAVYWPAVYAYLRRTGMTPDTAADATQEFFAGVVLSDRRLLDRAQPGKGRLRSLILAALRNHRIDCFRRERAGGAGQSALNAAHVAHLEGSLARVDARAGAPEVEFERRWTMAQVDVALKRCRDHFERHKPRHWAAFEDRVLGPAVRFTSQAPLSELAARLGFRTPADAAAAVQVVKKRFLVIFRELVSEVGDDIQAERQSMLELLQ